MAAPLAVIVGDVVSAYADVPMEPHLLDGTASTPSAAELVPEEILVQALVAGVTPSPALARPPAPAVTTSSRCRAYSPTAAGR